MLKRVIYWYSYSNYNLFYMTTPWETGRVSGSVAVCNARAAGLKRFHCQHILIKTFKSRQSAQGLGGGWGSVAAAFIACYLRFIYLNIFEQPIPKYFVAFRTLLKLWLTLDKRAQLCPRRAVACLFSPVCMPDTVRCCSCCCCFYCCCCCKLANLAGKQQPLVASVGRKIKFKFHFNLIRRKANLLCTDLSTSSSALQLPSSLSSPLLLSFTLCLALSLSQLVCLSLLQ